MLGLFFSKQNNPKEEKIRLLWRKKMIKEKNETLLE